MGVVRRNGLRAVLALLMSAPLGCSSTTTFEDEGTVCLELDAQGNVRVTVGFPACLSSSCDQALDTSCTVTRKGTTLQVVSRGAYESEAGSCTLDCQSLTASCDATPNIGLTEPGDYTVKHGARTASVSLTPLMPVCVFEP